MTRLKETDIEEISGALTIYNKTLQANFGAGLFDIAAYAVNKQPGEMVALLDKATIGVVPITSGQGVISGFSATVQSIINFLGGKAFVTKGSDVGGLAEAVSRGAEVLFLADDDNFVALHLKSGRVVCNSEATGRGYSAALALMAQGLSKKQVLVVGAGPVGLGAAAFLLQQQAIVSVFDINRKKAEAIRKSLPDVQVADSLEAALAKCSLVLEATPSANVIKACHVTEKMMVAAPGVPLGVEPEAAALLNNRLLHDVLEIGVATMLFSVLAVN
ncbi:MAG: 3-methylornithyl-N6-L-lysine dehydrogenase PylD [Pelosinus sp.]|nr:3-methylornithyl-N6-L-lysine dehydrogenase PylD [Pelosinus sp.]